MVRRASLSLSDGWRYGCFGRRHAAHRAHRHIRLFRRLRAPLAQPALARPADRHIPSQQRLLLALATDTQGLNDELVGRLFHLHCSYAGGHGSLAA